MKLVKAIIAIPLLSVTLMADADSLIVVGKGSKVFDEPNAKGYVTLNQKDEEVSIIPGMVFKKSDGSNGWYMIEYSPGLHGYVSEQIEISECVAPVAGEYKVANNPSQKIKVANNNGKWTATIGEKSYSGICENNVIVFYDAKNNMAYSLVDLGKGPVVMSYDNAVTKFF